MYVMEMSNIFPINLYVYLNVFCYCYINRINQKTVRCFILYLYNYENIKYVVLTCRVYDVSNLKIVRFRNK